MIECTPEQRRHRQWQWSGLLAGATVEALASLEILFHGTSPYLNEFW